MTKGAKNRRLVWNSTVIILIHVLLLYSTVSKLCVLHIASAPSSVGYTDTQILR